MKGKLLNKMVSALRLPPEIDLNLPKLTMYGRGELQLENHRGVLSYSEEELRFLTEYGIVTIHGANLQLLEFSMDRVSIRGRIDGWAYEDGKR